MLTIHNYFKRLYEQKWIFTCFKGPYADHILIPQGSTRSSIFFDIKWKPIFFWLQIQNFSFKFFVVLEIIGIPENNFLCIFMIASSPGVHTFFCLWRVNKKLPQGETSQNAFQRSRSINWKWKMCMLEWAYPPVSNFKQVATVGIIQYFCLFVCLFLFLFVFVFVFVFCFP